MPNILGGDQQHPAYMPRKLGPREVLIGNTLYTIKGHGDDMTVWWEDVSGNGGACAILVPKQVKSKMAALRRQEAKEAKAEATLGIDLNELQEEAEKLVALLEDRHPGLASWQELLDERLTSLSQTMSRYYSK